MAFIIPAIFIIVLGCAAIKKVNVYSCFTSGIESALKFVLSLLPCLAAVFMMCALFEESGLSELMIKLTSPAFSFFGVPEELTKLILIKPLSGSGSLAYLTEIITTYGSDSYVARCACVCYGSSETVFYIGAVYFSRTKRKKFTAALLISLFSYFASVVLCCALCKIL